MFLAYLHGICAQHCANSCLNKAYLLIFSPQDPLQSSLAKVKMCRNYFRHKQSKTDNTEMMALNAP